jgi:CheY-like chemotaxis protein
VRTPPRVLIADDNAANLRILKTRLAADGYDVVTAATARRRAFAAATRRPT